MANVSPSFAFASTAEGWSFSAGGSASSGAFQGGDGNPSGCLEATITRRNTDETSTWTWTGTFEDLGVPAGAVVTGYSSAAFDERCSTFTSGTLLSNGAFSINDGTLRQLVAKQDHTGTSSFTTRSASPAISGLSLASNTSISLILSVRGVTPNIGGATVIGRFDNPTVTIEYNPPVTGSSPLTLPALTAAASGTSALVISGTSALALPALTAAAAGLEEIPGTAALALPALTAAAAGLEEIPGTAALALPALTAAAAGLEEIPGTSVLALPALTAAAAGATGAVSGAAVLALPALTAAAAGLEEIPGTSVLALPALTAAAAGATGAVSGAAVLALPALTAAAAGLEEIPGTAALALPALTAAAAGSGGSGIGGSAALALPSLSLLSSGVMPLDPLRVTVVRGEVSARYVEAESVDPLDLPSVLPSFLLHNWNRSPATLETAYLTDITETPGSGAEERLSLRDRPLRTVGADWTGMGQNITSQLLMNIARMLHSRLPLPLYCDQGELTQAYSSGTYLYLNAQYRRYYEGGRILIGDPESGALTNVEIATIAAVEDGRLTLTGALSQAHPKYAFVFPLIDAEAKLSGRFDAITDFHGKAVLDFSEVHGKSALPPSSEDTLDNIVSVYNGVPVFRFSPNWNSKIQVSLTRPGAAVPLGRSTYTVLEGERPRFNFTATFTTTTRAAFWELLQFFDSRRGRARPFIFVSPNTLYEIIDLQTTHVDVEPFGNVEDHQEFLDKIFFEQTDGTYLIRDIGSITDNGSYWRISFSTAFASIPSNIERAGSAHLVRLFSDAMKEVWETTEICHVSLSMIDLPTEVDVEIDNIIDPVSYGASMNLSSLFLWASSAKNVSKAPTGGGFPAYTRVRLIEGTELDYAAFVDDSRLNANVLYALGLTFPEPYLAHYDPAQTNNPAVLTNFDAWKYNQGRTSCEAPLNTAEWDLVFQGGTQKWWDDAQGFTLFWCGRLTKKGAGNDDHVLIWDGDKTYPTGSTQGFAFGTNFVRVGTFSAAFTSIASKADRFYVLRWEPGTSIRIYRSGVLKYESLSSIPFTVAKYSSNYTKVHTGVAIDSDPGLNQDKKIGKNGFFNTCLVYRKALSDAEMNLVGNYLADMYPSFWDEL